MSQSLYEKSNSTLPNRYKSMISNNAKTRTLICCDKNIHYANSYEQQQFLEDMALLKNIKCPSILKFSSGEIDSNFGNMPLVVMEANFPNLAAYLDENVTLNEENLFIILYGIAKGMDYLHSRNFYHGNLNASSILIEQSKDSYYPYIIDFSLSEGHSTFFHRPNESNDIKKSDIFSYSFLAYQMFTKKTIENPNDLNTTLSLVTNPFLKQILDYCWTKTQNPTFKELINDVFEKNNSFADKNQKKRINHYKKKFDTDQASKDEAEFQQRKRKKSFKLPINKSSSRPSLQDIVNFYNMSPQDSQEERSTTLTSAVQVESSTNENELSQPEMCESSNSETQTKETEKNRFQLLKEKANNGDIDSLVEVADIYFYGKHHKISFRKAKFFYKKAAAKSNNEALKKLAQFYRFGYCTKINKFKAFIYYLIAARNKDQESLNICKIMLLEQIIVHDSVPVTALNDKNDDVILDELIETFKDEINDAVTKLNDK